MIKFVLFAGLLAVLVSRSEAVKCEDIQICVTNFRVDDDDIGRLCASLRTMLDCMRSSLADCRDTNALPKSTQDSLDQQMQTYTDMMNSRCGSGGANGSGAVTVSVLTLMSSILAYFLL